VNRPYAYHASARDPDGQPLQQVYVEQFQAQYGFWRPSALPNYATLPTACSGT
jgi:hypothetical protein